MSELIAGVRVLLRPLAAADRPRLRAILAEPSVAHWWSPRGADVAVAGLYDGGVRAFAITRRPSRYRMRRLVVVVIALLVGACSSPASATPGPTFHLSTPSVSASPSGAPATMPTPPSSATAAPSDATESHAAPDLEAALPSILDGVSLGKESVDGTQFLGQDASGRSLSAFLALAGKTPTDFKAATAADPSGQLPVTFLAFQIPGVATNDLYEAIIAAGRAQNPLGTVSTVTISGKQVTKGASSSTGGSTYIYRFGNIVYGVQASDDTLAAAALAELPPITTAANPTPSAGSSSVPSEQPGASPGGSGEPFPNANEQAILDHVPAPLRSSCTRVHVIYPDEIDSVRCIPSSGPYVDYTVFADAATMNQAYQDDLAAYGTPTTSSAGCAGGDFENAYTIDGQSAGRYACVVDAANGSARVIEWTDDTTLIISYAASTSLSWDALISFWSNDAGPTH